MQNKYSLTRRKKGHWVDYTQLPASPSLWPISKIPCPSCLRDNYSEQPCRQTGPIKTGAFHICASIYLIFSWVRASAAAKSLQSCLTLCDPIDGSPPGSPIPGILQARKLEWVAISFSSAWKWKVKGKSLSRVRLLATPWTAAYQAPPPMGFSRREYWSGLPFPSAAH